MFDHRVIFCSIRVINSRCDILLDRSVVKRGFSRCSHINCNTQCFVYFIISRIHHSNDSISQAGVICQVRLLDYIILNALNVPLYALPTRLVILIVVKNTCAQET